MTSSDAPSTREFAHRPGYPMSFKRAPKRIRGEFAGETIVDAVQAMVMHEDGHRPVWYFSRDEVRMDLLSRTSHSSH